MANGFDTPVGADAYPKGTGSGSRSYLAGRHWRPAARQSGIDKHHEWLHDKRDPFTLAGRDDPARRVTSPGRDG